MFRSLRKIMSLLVTLILFISLLTPLTVQAKGLVIEYDKPEVAIVIDVIDGEAIKVMHIQSTASKAIIEYIRILGVDSMANDDTYEYVKDQLLGKPVFIIYDNNYLPVTDEYKNAYVFLNTDVSLNETLLTYGYAKLDESFSNATYYKDLVTAEYFAIRQEKGIHKISTSPSNIININLASSAIIEDHFAISSSLASAIVSYRTRNPINNSTELGFIHDEIDREFILNHRASIHYTTNINDATLYELTSLFSSSNGLNMAHDVNRDRVFNPFTKIEDLKSITSVSSYYNLIEPFITTTINDNLYLDKDILIANINTASSAELTKAAGISSYNSDKIVELRDKYGYIYRSLEELKKANFPLMNMNLDSYKDNLSFKTEINKASDFELMSLFSSFDLSEELKEKMLDKINYKKPFYNYQSIEAVLGSAFYDLLEPFIYIDGVDKNQIAPLNLNGSSNEEIVSFLKLTGDAKLKVLARKTDYISPSQLSYIPAEKMKSVTLYTNINTASYEELLNLHSKITPAIANTIIEYRSYYPFYSLAEVKEVLSEIKQLYLYELIKNEIVFY